MLCRTDYVSANRSQSAQRDTKITMQSLPFVFAVARCALDDLIDLYTRCSLTTHHNYDNVPLTEH